MTRKIFFLAVQLPTMRKNILLTNSNKLFTGYDNVTHEEFILIPDTYDWIYFIPESGLDFILMRFLGETPGWISAILKSDIEIYSNYENIWYNQSNFTQFNVDNKDYPYGNNWGRYWGIVNPAHMDWQPTANLGYKTIAEYNALLSQMDNVTKRNLTGMRIYQ